MEASFYIIVRKCIFINFSIRGSSTSSQYAQSKGLCLPAWLLVKMLYMYMPNN